MMRTLGFFLLAFLFSTSLTFGQAEKSLKHQADSVLITFKDTVSNLAFDSIAHNLGNIVPSNENNRVVKHFKYIGTEPIVITKAWTGDPHYICDYPREPLIPNKIYSFTVCFWHQDRQGSMTKRMGFQLSNGETVSFVFTGKYLPKTEIPK